MKEFINIQNCGNYRGIKLTSHTMKPWEKTIDQRSRNESLIFDNQFGFMPDKLTIKAINLNGDQLSNDGANRMIYFYSHIPKK